MEKVYAVTCGIYSDYRVEAIFTTKDKAKEFMEYIPSDDYNDIEEYELNPMSVDLVKQGYQLWIIHMRKDGTVEVIREYKLGPYGASEANKPNIWKRTKAPAFVNKPTCDVLIDIVWAKSKEHAIKIANEHRTQMIANNQF